MEWTTAIPLCIIFSECEEDWGGWEIFRKQGMNLDMSMFKRRIELNRILSSTEFWVLCISHPYIIAIDYNCIYRVILVLFNEQSEDSFNKFFWCTTVYSAKE